MNKRVAEEKIRSPPEVLADTPLICIYSCEHACSSVLAVFLSEKEGIYNDIDLTFVVDKFYPLMTMKSSCVFMKRKITFS